MVMLSTNEPKQEKERSIKKKSNLAAAVAVEDVIPLLLLRAIEEFPMHSKKLPWFGRHSMMPMRWKCDSETEEELCAGILYICC
ncbi:hypothetical protein MTR_7g070360 [Medicago truncatula]|uniref:Uncharacterized protein n=1 Tax=Medicago truncatula TaxID=3880 RepID=G7KU35_MEDTR|nr:hypothetical protein MTR_7g070360 [Medicago truncatula]